MPRLRKSITSKTKKSLRHQEENELATGPDAIPGETKADRRRRLERERKREIRAQKRTTTTHEDGDECSTRTRSKRIKKEPQDPDELGLSKNIFEPQSESEVEANADNSSQEENEREDPLNEGSDWMEQDDDFEPSKPRRKAKRKKSQRPKKQKQMIQTPGRRQGESVKDYKRRRASQLKGIKRREEENKLYDGPDPEAVEGETWADYRRRKDRERVKRQRALQKGKEKENPPIVELQTVARRNAIRGMRYRINNMVFTSFEKKWNSSQKRKPSTYEELEPEQAEEWLFNELFVQKIKIEFDSIRNEMISEAIELELGPNVPSKERVPPPPPALESQLPKGEKVTKREDDTEENYDTYHDIQVKAELEEVEEWDDNDDGNVQDWIAKTITTDKEDEEEINFHENTNLTLIQRKTHNEANLKKQKQQLQELETRLEHNRQRWITQSSEPQEARKRQLIDEERNLLIDKVLEEKKMLLEQAQKWLIQQRYIYSEETPTGRKARVDKIFKEQEEKYEARKSLKNSVENITKRRQSLKTSGANTIKKTSSTSEPGQGQLLPGVSPKRPKTDDMKAKIALSSNLRYHMERHEYDINLKLLNAKDSTEFENILIQPNVKKCIEYWANLTIVAKNTAKEVKQYRKMMGKFIQSIQSLDVSRISYTSKTPQLQKVESSATSNFNEFQEFFTSSGEIVKEHLKTRRFYYSKRGKTYKELTFELRFRHETGNRMSKLKKKYGGANNIPPEAMEKWKAFVEAGSVGWQAQLFQRSMRKQAKLIQAAIGKPKRSWTRRKEPATKATPSKKSSKSKTLNVEPTNQGHSSSWNHNQPTNYSHSAASYHSSTDYNDSVPDQQLDDVDDRDDNYSEEAGEGWVPLGTYQVPTQVPTAHVQYLDLDRHNQQHLLQNYQSQSHVVSHHEAVQGWSNPCGFQLQMNQYHNTTTPNFQPQFSSHSRNPPDHTDPDWSIEDEVQQSKKRRGRPKGSVNTNGNPRKRNRAAKLVNRSLVVQRRRHDRDVWGNKERKLKRAQKLAHPAENPLPLPQELSPFQRQQALQKLLETQLPVNVDNLCPKCSYCDMVFLEDSGLRVHLKKEHPDQEHPEHGNSSNEEQFEISEQTETKQKPRKKKEKNSRTRKSRKRDDLVCKLCSFTENHSGPSTYVNHLFTMHYACIKYICPYSRRFGKQKHLSCNTFTYERANLSQHFLHRHREESRNKWVLTVHPRTNTRSSEEFLCVDCTENFNSFSAVVQHYQIVHNTIRYSCEHCGILMTREDHLMDHKGIFHPEQNQTLSANPLSTSTIAIHKCNTCNSEFSSENHLQFHIQKGHSFLEEGNQHPVFCCDKCEKVFSSETNRNDHIEQDCNGRCFWCRKACYSEEEVESHISTCHSNEPPISEPFDPEPYYCAEPYKCEFCPKSYLTLFLLRQHCFRAHYFKEYIQLVKDKGFIVEPVNVNPVQPSDDPSSNNQSHSVTSQNKSSESTPEPMSCKYCDFSAPIHDVHMIYDDVMKRWCPLCNKLLSKNAMLVMHLDAKHGILKEAQVPHKPVGTPGIAEAGSDSISCFTCKKNFTPLEFHQYHSFYDMGLPKCDACEKTFVTQEHLKRHKMRVHNPRKQELTPDVIERLTHVTLIQQAKGEMTVYTCKICMKNYKTKEFASTHIRTVHEHDAFTRLMCPHCNTTFAHSHSLRDHIKNSHTEQSTNRLVCPGCQKTFTRHPQLKKHIAMFHPDVVYDSAIIKTVNIKEAAKNGQKFICNICSLDFIRKDGLKSHVTGKHFPIHFTVFCEVCGLQMSEKARRVHMKRRHKDFTPPKTSKISKQPIQLNSFQLMELMLQVGDWGTQITQDMSKERGQKSKRSSRKRTSRKRSSRKRSSMKRSRKKQVSEDESSDIESDTTDRKSSTKERTTRSTRRRRVESSDDESSEISNMDAGGNDSSSNQITLRSTRSKRQISTKLVQVSSDDESDIDSDNNDFSNRRRSNRRKPTSKRPTVKDLLSEDESMQISDVDSDDNESFSNRRSNRKKQTDKTSILKDLSEDESIQVSDDMDSDAIFGIEPDDDADDFGISPDEDAI